MTPASFCYRNDFILQHMLAKRIIAVFCVLIFSIQILPLRQIGSLLFGNTMNEEIPHSMPGIKENCGKYVSSYEFDFFSGSILTSDYLNNSNSYIHYASLLPANHTGEIHTPPPNYCF
jgi:hypothetical protein